MGRSRASHIRTLGQQGSYRSAAHAGSDAKTVDIGCAAYAPDDLFATHMCSRSNMNTTRSASTNP